jgi:hypothetical protein
VLSPTLLRTVLPAAASALTADLVGGPAVGATVLGVHGPAVYLDVVGRVLPVVAADAVPLPSALRLAVRAGEVPGGAGASSGGPWGVAVGDRVPVGDGRVVLPGMDLVVSRTWRPARVRPVPPDLRDECGSGRPGNRFRTHGAVGAPVSALLADATSSADTWLVDGIRSLFSGLECGRGRPGSRFRTQDEADAVARGVAALLGRGPGLTPSGDDALAGALLVSHALAAAAPLAGAVRARLGATTAVSAALLDAAADGFAARDVVTLVDAALAGDDVGVEAALPAVLALGHTSGRDVVTGIAAALTALAAVGTDGALGTHGAAGPDGSLGVPGAAARTGRADPAPRPAQTPTGRSAA